MCPTIRTSPEKAKPVSPVEAGPPEDRGTEGPASPSRRLEPLDLAGYALLVLAVLLLLVALRAELTVDGAYPHDAGLHLPAVERLAQAWERGESVLDCWVSEWVLGYPLWRSYQPLPHLATFALWLGLIEKVAISTVYAWLVYLLLATFPLTCFLGARWLGASVLESGCVAAISGLLASSPSYGLELGSYVWYGHGVYTQLFAQWLLPLAIGRLWNAVRQGRGLALAGVLGGAVALSHLLYGYVYAWTGVLMLLTRSADEPWRPRLGRLAVVFGVMGTLASFAVLPMLAASPYINLSGWEEPWKWDSFGHASVLGDLVRGDLLDAGRLPVLSLLLGLGGVAAAVRWRTERQRFLLAGFVLWLLLFCGRPTWGLLLYAFGIPPGFHLHRLIGAVHFFALLLAGAGLALVVESLRRVLVGRLRLAQAALPLALAVAILLPAVRERLAYLDENARGIAEQRQAQTEYANPLASVLDVVEARTRDSGGRAYAGLKAGWADEVGVGEIPLYFNLSYRHVPTLGFLFHAMSHAGEDMVLFDQNRKGHYALFGVGTVVARSERPLAGFLEPLEEIYPWKILAAPGGGYFEIVDTPFAFVGRLADAHRLTKQWLASPLVEARHHLRIALDEGAANLPDLRLDRFAPMPALDGFDPAPTGVILSERRRGEVYEARVALDEPGHLLFKMGFHPGWKATVDGAEAETVMLSPFFLGVPLKAGEHEVRLHYEPDPLKKPLLLLGLVTASCVFLLERILRNRGRRERSDPEDSE